MEYLALTNFKFGDYHIQFNVDDAEHLAVSLKQKYKIAEKIGISLSCSGFSDYFFEFGKEFQDEIINRTAHQSF